jgi:hypothetical protein
MELNHKRVTNGKNIWHVSGNIHLATEQIILNEIHGDINDTQGITDAVRSMLMQEGFMTKKQAE